MMFKFLEPSDITDEILRKVRATVAMSENNWNGIDLRDRKDMIATCYNVVAAKIEKERWKNAWHGQ